MYTAPKYELSPSFCPLHDQVAPCLFCLSPEVAMMVEEHSEQKGRGILFMKADQNSN